MGHESLFSFLRETDQKIKNYYTSCQERQFFRPEHIYQGVMSYLLRPAKRLRPAVMMMSCGCFGGEEMVGKIIPAAAGIELFHTWTLVHDDIIDNDDLRRGKATAHIELRDYGISDLGLEWDAAEEYGRSAAILAGDVQHGWVVSSFLECALNDSIDPNLIITILKDLESRVIGDLICGEMLDVQLGMVNFGGKMTIDEKTVLEMEWLKTGILLEFSAKAGAMLGIGTTDEQDSRVKAVADFAGNCGRAFQLQDDILGVVGNEKSLGKPVGSDIREGKKTLILLNSLTNANEEEKNTILEITGNKSATEDQVRRVTKLYQNLGGVDYARDMANSYIEKTMNGLEIIEESVYKELLLGWADFMVDREL